MRKSCPFTISITKDLKVRMDKVKNKNWSSIARKAFEKELDKELFTPITVEFSKLDGKYYIVDGIERIALMTQIKEDPNNEKKS